MKEKNESFCTAIHSCMKKRYMHKYKFHCTGEQIEYCLYTYLRWRVITGPIDCDGGVITDVIIGCI